MGNPASFADDRRQRANHRGWRKKSPGAEFQKRLEGKKELKEVLSAEPPRFEFLVP
jgi:hypothetical protein